MKQKGYGRKRQWHNLKKYTGICLEELRKTTTDVSQDHWAEI
jgi:hypothetical protein